MKTLISLSAKPKTLKITDEDYADLSKALLGVVKTHPNAYKDYKTNGFTDMRYNWDIFRASKFDIGRLYKYLNDTHINATLAAILHNKGKGK